VDGHKVSGSNPPEGPKGVLRVHVMATEMSGAVSSNRKNSHIDGLEAPEVSDTFKEAGVAGKIARSIPPNQVTLVGLPKAERGPPSKVSGWDGRDLKAVYHSGLPGAQAINVLKPPPLQRHPQTGWNNKSCSSIKSLNSVLVKVIVMAMGDKDSRSGGNLFPGHPWLYLTGDHKKAVTPNRVS